MNIRQLTVSLFLNFEICSRLFNLTTFVDTTAIEVFSRVFQGFASPTFEKYNIICL